MRKRILKKLRNDVRKSSILDVCTKTKIPYATLYRIVHEQSVGSIRVWEKLDSYYAKSKTPPAGEKKNGQGEPTA